MVTGCRFIYYVNVAIKMGEAKRRGSFEQRMQNPKGKRTVNLTATDREELNKIVKDELLKYREQLFKMGIPQ
jgi:hypothetical protein